MNKFSKKVNRYWLNNNSVQLKSSTKRCESIKPWNIIIKSRKDSENLKLYKNSLVASKGKSTNPWWYSRPSPSTVAF